MLVQHIALVPVAEDIDPSDLARVGAALQKQVLRDLAPLWGVSACVTAFPRLEDVPLGYWPILLTSHELSWGAGVHLDDNGQPYAQVELSPHWSQDASRACLELLVNPLGERCVTTASPRPDQGLVEVLVEVCAASAELSDGYAIDGVLVSDFCTPAYFVPDAALGLRAYSFHGSLGAPLQLRSGGHLTWCDVDTNSWWMRAQQGARTEDRRLGQLDRPFLSIRELVGRQRGGFTPDAALESWLRRARLARGDALRASQARARRLRALVGLAGDDESRFLAGSHGTPRLAQQRPELTPHAGVPAHTGVSAGARTLPSEAALEARGSAHAQPTEEPLEPVYTLVDDDDLVLDEAALPVPASSPAHEAVPASELTPLAQALRPPVHELAPPAPAALEAPAAAEVAIAPAPLPPASPAPAAAAPRAATPPPIANMGRSRPAARPARPTAPAGAGSAANTASSSIAPMLLAREPEARSGGFRDARLLAVAAAVGIGFFALVARERGGAHAASHSPPASTQQPGAGAKAALTPAATPPMTAAPADPGAVTPPPAAGAPIPTVTPLGSTSASAHAADAGVQPRLAANSAPARRTRKPASAEEPPAAKPEPSIEDLLDTRR